MTPDTLSTPALEAALVRLEDAVLGEQEVRAVRARLPWFVGEPPCRDLHLDLAGVVAPTAGGLGVLVALHHHLRAAGCRLVLLNVGPMAYAAFRVAGLTGLLDVRPAP